MDNTDLAHKSPLRTQLDINAPRRNMRTDAFRLYGMFAVICIHTGPFLDGNAPGALGILINQLSRFAVPMFFILSGYFWIDGIQRTRTDPLSFSMKSARRLLQLWLFWNAVYGFALWAGKGFPTVDSMRDSFLAALSAGKWMEGTSEHLWFFFSLAQAVLIAGLALRLRIPKTVCVLVVASLYAACLAGGAYAGTPFGMAFPFNTRNLVFISVPYFAIGAALHSATMNNVVLARCLVGGGAVLHIAEAVWLHTAYSVQAIDILLGTIPFAVGVSMLALRPDDLLSRVRAAARVGRYGLGIYAGHMLFLEPLRRASDSLPLSFRSTLLPLAVLLASYAFARFMSQFRPLKQYVY
jgi:surface polysaccharide O-acyltransferase-like enzyme